MNVATYLRVSTADQDVEGQRLELATYAKAKGWHIIAEFADVASGAKNDRLQLNALLEAVHLKSYDAVLCVKLDRLARSLAHFALMVDLFTKADVALICTSQGIDTSKTNACGRLQMAVLSAVAEFERELIRERTKAGLAVARANGKVLGKVSKLMPDDAGRTAIVKQWRTEGRPGALAELARRLGGVSRATAMRVEDKYVRELSTPEEVVID
jgi:putative DNA-invertase from lambdoid prophage Rac